MNEDNILNIEQDEVWERWRCEVDKGQALLRVDTHRRWYKQKCAAFIQQTLIQFPFHASLLLALRVLQCMRFGASLVDATIGTNLPLQERREQC